jgi:RNA polymerase sigma-70 factor (ECF subfamily)
MQSSKARSMAAVPAVAAYPFRGCGDDELMLLTQDGSRTAFDVLVRRHQARALRLAARYLGDISLAKDVAQSAFLELFRSRDRYQARGQFVPYLCRIVLNQCRMVRRSSRVHLRLLSDDHAAVRALDTESLLSREYGRDLQRALSLLSEKLRIVVVLRYVTDLDLSEIARVVGIPIGSVKRRLFDAMAKLREILQEEP